MNELDQAIAKVPAGKWAVAVSGGADSVALLLLLRHRDDLSLHAVHLDHETRAGESGLDAAFVVDLAKHLGLPVTVKTRTDVAADQDAQSAKPRAAKANPSAKYRALRHQLFRETIEKENLNGIILAHHAGDQAETILQRLLRNSPVTALAGMSQRSTLHGMTLLRPLLKIDPQTLRDYLKSKNQPWREDSSNASNQYQRNQLRPILKAHAELQQSLLKLGESSARWKDWLQQNAPTLPKQFPTEQLANLPEVLAHESAKQWLASIGCPPSEITGQVIHRLIQMSRDAATPGKQQFPGNMHVSRRKCVIFRAS